MESLVKLPAVRDVNNVTSLRKIYDRVESSIRNLKSVGINPDSYGSLLTPLLTKKNTAWVTNGYNWKVFWWNLEFRETHESL